MTKYAEIDNRVAFAVFATAAGLLSALFLASVTIQAPRIPEELMPFFAAHRARYVFMAVTVLLWSTASVPFIVCLGALLGAREHALAFSATLLAAGGVLLLSFATFGFVGAFLSIAAASTVAPSHGDANYQAAIWGNLSYFLTDPGLMTLGLGQFLFARLARKAALFPGSVCLIGYLGGLAGLLTLAVYQTPVLAITQIGAFGIWGFATGVLLFRRKGGRAERSEV
jgi:hypothetical protein